MCGDGHGGGEPGGADAADGDVAPLRPGLDAVVLLAGRGTESGVDGGDFLVEQSGQDAAAPLAEQGDRVGGRSGGGPVVEVLGGGAEQHITEDGRCDQYALPGGGGHRQQDVADEIAGELVEDDELAAARGDGEVVVAEFPVEFVGVESGGVDQVAGAQRSPGGGEGVDFVVAVDVPHPAVEVQMDSGAHGLGGVGERGGPGADDALVGDFERAEGTRSQMGLAGTQFLRVQEACRAVVVPLRLRQQGRQCGQLFLVPGDEQGPDAFDGDAGLGRVRAESVLPLAYEPGFQGAGYGVESGVQDGGVGLRGAVADVVGGVQECGAQPVAGQFAGDGGADDARADDGHVVGRGAGRLVGGEFTGRGDREGHRVALVRLRHGPAGSVRRSGTRRAVRPPRRRRSGVRTRRRASSRAGPAGRGVVGRGRAGRRLRRRAR